MIGETSGSTMLARRRVTNLRLREEPIHITTGCSGRPSIFLLSETTGCARGNHCFLFE